MIYVGYEFNLDKSQLRKYLTDYLVAMTAAGFPWIFVAVYFIIVLSLDWKLALLAGRFAAPTSAGILFSMLEAAGLKETWLFKKARILAIFDDLDDPPHDPFEGHRNRHEVGTLRRCISLLHTAGPRVG